MKLNEFNTENILDNLRTFSYTTVEDGESVTKNVTLFSHEQTPIANKLFLQSQGRLKADDIMFDYKAGDISASDLSAMILIVIKSQLVQLWKEWEADYNPLWNVDGVEKRTIKTEFGKVVEHEKDSSLTDEQITDGKAIDEQKVDGKDNLTHGLEIEIEEPTSTHKVSAFDSTDYVNQSQDGATTHTTSHSGSDDRAISMGKIEHTSGIGKIKHTSDGKDTDTDSGEENVTDIYERHGNIGVTMSTQLLRDGENFWGQFNFFDKYFSLIAEQLTIPIYE